MKIVIAPDSFKGSASSRDIANWIEQGIHSVIPNCETVKVEIGDGGEGSLDAILKSGFSSHTIEVAGPLGNPVSAQLAIKEQITFIEMAQASGLALGEKDALNSSSFGTGQMIYEALNMGAKTIILAVGGTATTDAGAGALQALGVKLKDSSGEEVAPGGASLKHCAEIDLSGLDPRLSEVSFILASDVTNPLLGSLGTARVFSPQKGATPEDVEILEESLSHFATLAGNQFASQPGSGAAGGFGFMAYTFLGATAQSGIDVILDLIDFDSQLIGADFIITGEGKFDSQSVQGKAPWGILRRAKKIAIPTFLVCGDADTDQSTTFKEIFTLTAIEPDIDVCIKNPAPLVKIIGAQIAELIKEL